MADGRPNGVSSRHRRRWLFANCVFDEANWTLVVNGRRVAIETKPLETLRQLLLHAGNVVSKDELLEAVWPDVTVVEASLTTAVRKLRLALNDGRRGRHIIETVSGIGYRIAVPVDVQAIDRSAGHAAEARRQNPLPEAAVPAAQARPDSPLMARLMSVAGGLAIVLAGMAVAFGPPQDAAATRGRPAYIQAEAATALRKLDLNAIEKLIAAGWDPAQPLDKEGNTPLDALLNICEWDKAHDRRQMLMVARTLLDAGADVTQRNIWGDTAYSIAKAPRYCGADHPVTQMLEAMCYGGDLAPRDRCLATYELTAEQRRAQGLPPKG